MRPIRLSQTGSGTTTNAIPMDVYLTPFNVGIGVDVSGTVNFTVQHTFDNIFDSAVTPNWYDHPVLQSLTIDVDGNYAFPVSAVRLKVNSGSGEAKFRVIQAGVFG